MFKKNPRLAVIKQKDWLEEHDNGSNLIVFDDIVSKDQMRQLI